MWLGEESEHLFRIDHSTFISAWLMESNGEEARGGCPRKLRDFFLIFEKKILCLQIAIRESIMDVYIGAQRR